VDIKPQESEDGPPLRWNWDSALLISPHSHTRLYYGAQILFQSDDRGNTWRAISPDLTRNLDRNQLKVMGRVWGVDTVAKNTSTSFYGTIVAVSESPLVSGLIYAGTDDGLVQVTEDGGKTWRKIDTFPHLDVPDYAYVSDIEASLHDPDTVYVVLYNYKSGDFRPYVVMSPDRGKSWVSIAAGLPERGPTHTIAQDHVQPNLLFVGTETGVFVTFDGGTKWIRFKGGMPTIAVRDLEIQRRENDLVAGTFGRGFYILDDYSPLREVDLSLIEKEAHLFEIKKAQMFIQAAPLSGRDKAYQGASFYTAPNPPYGATFTYYLKESLKTEKAQRQEKDRNLAKQGKDVPYPDWDALKTEDREESPAILLTVRDSDDNVVRRIKGSSSAGIHRTTWDFRYPGLSPLSLQGDSRGAMVVPGRYSVSVASLVDGTLTQLVEPTPFYAEPLGMSDMSQANRQKTLDYYTKVGALQRAVMGAYSVARETEEHLQYMKRATETTPTIDPKLREDVRSVELRLKDMLEQFRGDPTKPRRSEPGFPGLLDRLQNANRGCWSTTTGPTNTHQQSYEMAVEQFSALISPLRKLVEQEVPALGRKLEAAKAPWTPGRRIPDWKKP
jgi:hypothetical protein